MQLKRQNALVSLVEAFIDVMYVAHLLFALVLGKRGSVNVQMYLLETIIRFGSLFKQIRKTLN